MNNKKPTTSEIMGVILATLIFAVLTLPILHYTGIQDLLTKFSADSAKFLIQFFNHPPG